MIHGLYILLLISQTWFAKLTIHHPPAPLRFPREAAKEEPLSCPVPWAEGQMLVAAKDWG